MMEVGIPPASAQTRLRLMQSKNDVLSDEMFPRGAACCQVSLSHECLQEKMNFRPFMTHRWPLLESA